MGVCIAVPTPCHKPEFVANIWDLFTKQEVISKTVATTVWKVTKNTNGRTFVLKQTARSSKVNRKTFENELNFLSQNSHPNIIKLEGSYINNDYFYICTHYCDGKRLLDQMKGINLLSEKSASRIVKTIITAVDFFHVLGFVHRDLKPENIMFHQRDEDEDEERNIIIIDWGNATPIDDNTTYKSFCGSPHYIAPECFRSRQGWEMKKTDMFAVGVIAFGLLTGRFPFPSLRKEKIEMEISWPSNLSENCKNFIGLLLEENTQKRMNTTEALNHPWMN